MAAMSISDCLVSRYTVPRKLSGMDSCTAGQGTGRRAAAVHGRAGSAATEGGREGGVRSGDAGSGRRTAVGPQTRLLHAQRDTQPANTEL